MLLPPSSSFIIHSFFCMITDYTWLKIWVWVVWRGKHRVLFQHKLPYCPHIDRCGQKSFCHTYDWSKDCRLVYRHFWANIIFCNELSVIATPGQIGLTIGFCMQYIWLWCEEAHNSDYSKVLYSGSIDIIWLLWLIFVWLLKERSCFQQIKLHCWFYWWQTTTSIKNPTATTPNFLLDKLNLCINFIQQLVSV